MDTHEIKKKRRMIVDISKKSVKKIRELIVFTALESRTGADVGRKESRNPAAVPG